MTLPEVCPLDENQNCKGRECHLFCLEWRTREPICLIGYNTTSKVKSWKDGRKQDTYAADTYRKLGQQSGPRKKSISEKGDWIPTRLSENSQGKPVQRREVDLDQNTVSQKMVSQRQVVSSTASKPEIEYDRRQYDRKSQESYAENEDEAEKAFMRLEARLKKEKVEEKPVIFGKPQSKIREKPKVPEKVVSSNKHTTIFTSADRDDKRDAYPQGGDERIKKPPEGKEKRKKLDEVIEIDTPEVYDEEFWS